MITAMTPTRIGAAIRAIRMRRGWTQIELARRAGVARGAISAVERGHLARLTFESLERIARTLDASVDVRLSWRGDELDRLLNRDHSAMHEQVARLLQGSPGWTFAPEVSFAYFGERGIIDILAFHHPTRRLLVIELKTTIVDVQEHMGTMDRKRRLAIRIARDRGWFPAGVSVWLVIADTRTNHRRIAAHRTTLRAAFPQDGRRIRSWLRAPSP